MNSVKKMALLLVVMSMAACSGSSSSDKGGKAGSCDGVEAPALLADEEAATIPASIAGTYKLTYVESAEGSGIEDGSTVEMVVAEDGGLTIDGKVTFCNPVLFANNPHEAIWKDEENDLRFALSSLELGFNEVNVTDNLDYYSGFTFYGQYRDK